MSQSILLTKSNCIESQSSFLVDEPYVRSRDFVQSPFRYPGGKFYALKYILPVLNCVPHTEYREPFIGGGSVFFGKTKVSLNWINDLEPNLITTYQVIANPSLVEELIESVSVEIASKQRHSEIKLITPKTALEIAYKTYYLNRTSYSGIINKPAWGYGEGFSIPPANWGKYIRGASLKLQDVKITNHDFSTLIESPAKHGNVLLYLDPPYFLADQKRAYEKSFILEDHLRLNELLKNTSHYFCLSYDDCQEIRDMYSWANIYERSWFYNTANSKGPRKVGNELLITNYEVRHPLQTSLL